MSLYTNISRVYAYRTVLLDAWRLCMSRLQISSTSFTRLMICSIRLYQWSTVTGRYCEARIVTMLESELSVDSRPLTGSTSLLCCFPTQCHESWTSSIIPTTSTSRLYSTAKSTLTVLAPLLSSVTYIKEA